MNASGKTTTFAPLAAASPTSRTALSTHASASKGTAPACTTAARTTPPPALFIVRLPVGVAASRAHFHRVAHADRSRLRHHPVHPEHEPELRMLAVGRERRERLRSQHLARRLVGRRHLAAPARLRGAEDGVADGDLLPAVL